MMEEVMDRSQKNMPETVFDLGDARVETKGPPSGVLHDFIAPSRTGSAGLVDE